MKSILIVWVIGLVINANAACPTVMDELVFTNYNNASSTNGLNATMHLKIFKDTWLEKTEALHGSLQSIPISIQSAAGTSTLQMSWTSLVFGLAKKLEASPTGNKDIDYLIGDLDPEFKNIAYSAAIDCSSQWDGIFNVTDMIDVVIYNNKLQSFLGRAAIYLKSGNPRIQEEKNNTRQLPFSKMPSI